jgi:ParB family chromosome partitioning protein
MAEKKEKKPTARRRRKPAGKSCGLTAAELQSGAAPSEIAELQRAVERDSGKVMGAYREPYAGSWVMLAALPIEQVEPTPYQRNLSDAHARKLENVIAKLGRFLDPIIVVRAKEAGDGAARYWTPNGHHRLSAMRALGAKCIAAILVPETAAAYQILALNTEKAHNLREKSLETIRMARALAEMSDRREKDFAFEFEQPAFLTLGICYEERPRLSGGAYQSILRRVDEFLDVPIGKALKERERRGKKILKLDDAVSAAVEKLKAKGLTSPYLKAFVVSRVNYTRFSKATSFDYDEALDKIVASAQKFNIDRIKQEDVAKSGGGPPDEE